MLICLSFSIYLKNETKVSRITRASTSVAAAGAYIDCTMNLCFPLSTVSASRGCSITRKQDNLIAKLRLKAGCNAFQCRL